MLRKEIAHPASSAKLAAGRCATHTITGATKAVGQTTFSGNLTAGDTINVGGTVFTAVASGASGNQFNVAGSLTLTLDNIVTVLNASVVPAVALVTWSKSGTTILLGVVKVAGVQGNAPTVTLAASSSGAVTVNFAGGVSGENPTGKFEANSDPGGTDAEVYALVTNVSSQTTAFTLPLGEEGQRLLMYLSVKGTGSNAVVTGTFAGGTTVTLDTVGKYFSARFLGGSWVVMSNTGTLA